MSENYDLFGHAIPDWKGKRGRPPYQPTEQDRNKIKLLLALGWSIERMSNAIDVSPATLKRYFRAELKDRTAMRDRMTARLFEVAMEQANAGKVAAIKQLEKMIERNDALDIEARLRQGHKPSDDGQPVREAKKGKKELARDAAKTAGEGSSWGNDLLPGLAH